MAIEVIGMYATSTGGAESGLANIDIPQDGAILGLDWDAHVDLDADAEVWDCELSFIVPLFTPI